MLNIYFQTDKEVIQFCESFFSCHKQIELRWKTHRDWGNHLQFDDEVITQETIEAMAKAMVDVFINFQLSDEIKEIIMEDYYYKNDDEINHILELTYQILKDQQRPVNKKSRTRPIPFLLTLFMGNISSSSTVYYQSMIRFQLNTFKGLLKDDIGLAIDEFKLEEDHQEFVEVLRSYIVKKEPVYGEVHVLQGSNFSFYRSNGKHFTTMELRHMMYQEPLYIVGLDSDELNLAPLIAIAPEKVFIYGDNPSDPKTLTIINVFQERVIFQPASHFPFHNSIGKSKKV